MLWSVLGLGLRVALMGGRVLRTGKRWAAAATLLWTLASHAQAQAADIVVLAAAAVQEPLEAVVHAFEHDTGNKVAMTLGSVGAIQTKLKAGANADLVILSTALVTAAEKDGSARAGIHAADTW